MESRDRRKDHAFLGNIKRFDLPVGLSYVHRSDRIEGGVLFIDIVAVIQRDVNHPAVVSGRQANLVVLALHIRHDLLAVYLDCLLVRPGRGREHAAQEEAVQLHGSQFQSQSQSQSDG